MDDEIVCEIQIAVSLSRLGSGTSYYSSAIIGNFRSSAPELSIVSESSQLYRELHNSGHDIGNCCYCRSSLSLNQLVIQHSSIILFCLIKFDLPVKL